MNNEKPYRKPYRNPIGGVAVGIFIICLAVAIFLGGFSASWILPILFVGLAFASLIGAFSSYDHRAAYGGLQGFVWLLGLALCFVIGFWPWILLPLGVSIILGALAKPIMHGMRNSVLPPTNQQYQPYQPYQSGYQEGQAYQPGQPYQRYQPYQSGQSDQPYQSAEQPLEQAQVVSQESEPK